MRSENSLLTRCSYILGMVALVLVIPPLASWLALFLHLGLASEHSFITQCFDLPELIQIIVMVDCPAVAVISGAASLRYLPKENQKGQFLSVATVAAGMILVVLTALATTRAS